MSKKNNKQIIKRKYDYAIALEKEAERKRLLRQQRRKANIEAKEAFKDLEGLGLNDIKKVQEDCEEDYETISQDMSIEDQNHKKSSKRPKIIKKVNNRLIKYQKKMERKIKKMPISISRLRDMETE